MLTLQFILVSSDANKNSDASPIFTPWRVTLRLSALPQVFSTAGQCLCGSLYLLSGHWVASLSVQTQHVTSLETPPCTGHFPSFHYLWMNLPALSPLPTLWF